MSKFTKKLDESWTIKEFNGVKSYLPAKGSVPTDVIPGEYEGGFQLWECTNDLLEFMKKYDFKDKNVFELGCGRGLPGILSAVNGAKKVVLQDFNIDVIERLTIPNVELNGISSDIIEYSASSWSDCSKLFQRNIYDYVLASETIYRKEQIPVFVDAIRYLIKNDGIAIIAAKRTYFGLTGSVAEFIKIACEYFNCEIHNVEDPRINVKRDIVVLKPKQET